MGVYWAKPTLEDIAAQRAMLERGEEKRKAAKQAEERDRLRDTFAAAALTGFVADGIRDADDYDRQLICRDAYRWADAMLHERLRQSDRSQPVEPADATPDTHATPVEGSVQGRCTLTAEEREAIEVAAVAYAGDHGERFAAILRQLLERLG